MSSADILMDPLSFPKVLILFTTTTVWNMPVVGSSGSSSSRRRRNEHHEGQKVIVLTSFIQHTNWLSIMPRAAITTTTTTTTSATTTDQRWFVPIPRYYPVPYRPPCIVLDHQVSPADTHTHTDKEPYHGIRKGGRGEGVVIVVVVVVVVIKMWPYLIHKIVF